jgi:hypothetical protein
MCDSCSQCAFQRFHALMPARAKAGMQTLREVDKLASRVLCL